MKVAATILATLLWAATPSHAETGFLDRSVVIDGETYRYQVFVPAEHTAGRLWRVIVDLHGDGGQGSDGLLQTARGLANQIRLRRPAFPAIVVFPQARVGTRFVAPAAMQDLVVAQLDRTIAELRGDPARVYLTGYSMGGASVYRIAYRWPERFAGVVVIAGPVLAPDRAPAALIMLDRRTNSFAAASDPITALASGIAKIPIWIFHGAADETLPVDQTRRLVAALEAIGAPVRYTEGSGVDHIGAAQLGYADPEMVNWLLAQKR